MTVKTRKKSLHVVYEGYAEGYFLEHLAKHSDVRLNTHFCNGGGANQIVIAGIQRFSYDIPVLVFFDEDFEWKPRQKISGESLEGLARAWKLDKDVLNGCHYRELQSLNKDRKNPILVVSRPQSLEGFLLRLLDVPAKDLEGKSTKQLKDHLAGFLGSVVQNEEDKEKIKEYDRKIAEYRKEIAKEKEGEPNYRQHRKLLEAKIDACGRDKNEVVFTRFLSEKLPLAAISAKREDIPELNILLNAFGL